MTSSRMKTKITLLTQTIGIATLLSGCVFGENKQFFEQIPTGNSLETPSTPNQTTSSNPSPSATPTGNGGNNPGGTTGGTASGGILDRFMVAGASSPKIDILFCVDNSPSMDAKQAILANSFNGFIQGFTQQGLDFHIGIITSDVDSTRSSTWASRMPNYPGANRGRLLTRYSSDRFLTNQTSGLVSKFEDNARVGTQGSSREQCLDSFIYAMESSQVGLGGWNAGFFRPDSLLSFVVISDENEDIQDGETIEARVARLKASVLGLSNVNSRGFRFDFIINKNYPKPAYTPAPGDLQYYPARYLAAASLLSAGTYDIAQNFSGDLLNISQGMIQQASHEFKLTDLPKDSTSIQVTLGGLSVDQSATNGYIYHADRNTIELTGATAASAAGKELVVTYL